MARRSLRPAQAIRMCVGCRVRAAKSDLLRLVAAGDEVVPDPRARHAGRGAYLHPSLGCLERARRRRAFPRALRLPGPLGTGKIAEYLARPGGSPQGQGRRTEGMDGSSAGESRLRR